MTLVLPFVFVFLSAVRMRLGREKEHDCLLYPPITATEYRHCFFFFVLKIVQLQTPVIRGHVRRYLAFARKTSVQGTIHWLFESRQAQREIIANILITNSDTQEEQPTDQRTPAK